MDLMISYKSQKILTLNKNDIVNAGGKRSMDDLNECLVTRCLLKVQTFWG